MPKDVSRDLQVANSLQDPFIRRSLKAALHFRRYLPFYAFTVVWVLLLAVFPTIQHHDDGGNDQAATDLSAAGATGDGAAATSAASGGAAGPAATTATGATNTAAGGKVAAAKAPVTRSVAQSLAAKAQNGATRGGVECAAGVKQIPDSTYAPACVSAFSGDNGGSTYQGVNATTIVVVRRGFADSANSQAAAQIAKQAGAASSEDVYATRDIFLKYFDQMFELYGRKVKYIDYESKYGDSTQESLGQGRDGACQDAQYIVDNYHPFAVIGGKNTAGQSSVFSECLAERKILALGAAPYYPESWYKKYHPYAWGGVMECERISYQTAEYIGKRLANKKAQWAGDVTLQQKNRYFGIYIPDNDGYQACGNIMKSELKSKYGVPKTDQYNYQLDLSRFADQAAQAMVQFQADGVTTVVMADDPYSNIFLTQAAAKQQYHPEWFHIGTALNDLDNVARLWDPTEINPHHLWGMSQLGSTNKLIGPQSEEGRLYKRLTGKEIVGGTDGQYWAYLGLYAMIQDAGPLLTPASVAEGTFTAPASGAPDYAVGYISYQDGPDGTPGGRDHTGIDDAREIFWEHDPNMAPNASSDPSTCTKSPDPYYNGLNDGCEGTYKES
ncbi:MAG: hypothetical protein V7636_313, partial [Actinomycetota bacterium]